jgi:hypothetical protein
MALSSEDIQKIVNRFAAKRKGWEQMTQSTPLNPITKQRASTQYPEYWSGYNYAAKMYDSILPHSRSDVYPEHLLSVRAHNQTDAQALYIKANYKAYESEDKAREASLRLKFQVSESVRQIVFPNILQPSEES